MSNTLASNGSTTASGRERALAWQLRDVLGIDPFHNLRSSFGFDYDVRRTEHGYEVEVPIPGYNSSQLEISVKDDVLTVLGKNEKRSFSRSFAVPEDVDQDAIDATVRDGILTLDMRRRPEAQPKKILVK
jgi:HSP20 family protein